MDWLNYHHLLYFWTVAKEGGITRAAEKLHLAQPTLSSQIKKLEKSLGVELLNRTGRTVSLTEVGQVVYRYAEDIFSLGDELKETLRGNSPMGRLRLVVGVPDVLPKIVVYDLLKPVLALSDDVQLVCYEGKSQDLLADLALHRIDVVLADSPLTPQSHVRAFNHLLGECEIAFLAVRSLAKKYREGFPHSLTGAPLLVPTQNTTLRRHLEQWFEDQDIHPHIAHEFEDSAVLKVFGQAGEGLFVVPTAIEEKVKQQYSVEHVGRVPEVRERFYAISVERRLKHPAVVAISRAAKNELFRK